MTKKTNIFVSCMIAKPTNRYSCDQERIFESIVTKMVCNTFIVNRSKILLNPKSCYFVSISTWLLQLPPSLMETSWRGGQPLNPLNPKTGSSRAKQGQCAAEPGSYKSRQEYRAGGAFTGAWGSCPALPIDTCLFAGPFWGILYRLLLSKFLVVTLILPARMDLWALNSCPPT